MAGVAPDTKRVVLEALEAEEARLEQMLRGLGEPQWNHDSGCEGWSVADVVLHLAQTEEAVSSLIAGETDDVPYLPGSSSADEAMQRWVRAEHGQSPEEIFDRWTTARRRALAALRDAAPDRKVPWVAIPLKPLTLATTRLAEHWAHGLDIAEPLGIEYPDTNRLEHIAWLAHRTLPFAYAFEARGDAPAVRLELEAPQNGRWVIGAADADVVIAGPASQFCRVAAKRLAPQEADALVLEGTRAGEVLEVVRTYA
ncbi:maleylpyruvate isomerase family mycothiol-dependent enzyme [Phytoactinopolyspora mesophila]|uniref:Maleylpyruvate isomerase family mycothiol-dependent enzyme n=1 Tax=Phytoactinopolyspora mesophila TaxID=2650750 RepID=A0A7K3LXY3_9ACTN|nr:maleylpyruvate isomerase family mycothiol-dependent enzyme [Phytoactinopolyspora mesophila]NDL55889.1 maleylpyruvate isomerase family mycothiol-dependent enzyme [Phytoactinopolyspora mesophila]